jgi:CheY-like chemotaxis protein
MVDGETVPPSILVVEDDDDVREAVGELLLGRGYLIRVARDGREALAILASSPIDLMVLDLTLPDMTGEELLERKAADPALASIPVVIASGADRLDLALPVLAKPYEASSLLAMVENGVAPAVED